MGSGSLRYQKIHLRWVAFEMSKLVPTRIQGGGKGACLVGWGGRGMSCHAQQGRQKSLRSCVLSEAWRKVL